MNPFRFGFVKKQLRADLIGKDSHRGVTLSYAWLANQFGHFSLGFIPALLLYLLLREKDQLPWPAFSAALAISSGWFIFETYNLLGPILQQKKSRKGQLKKNHPVFEVPWRNLVFDTVTDLLFFALGAFTLALLLEYRLLTLVVVCVLSILLFYPVYYWYICKIYVQNAGFPFHMRLCQWSFSISLEDRATVLDFLHSKRNRHLLIFGNGRSGKTSMGVGIAHEISMQHKRCYYISATKLMEQFSMSDASIIESGHANWSWRNTRLLLVDDLHTAMEVLDGSILIDRFFEKLSAGRYGAKNKKSLSRQSVIWVLGDDGPRHAEQHHWEYRLQQLGVEPCDILSIHLKGSTGALRKKAI
jgi:hypothetical protein